MEVETTCAFGRPAGVVDVGDAVTMVGAIAADTGQGDARAAELDLRCPAASSAALILSRTSSKCTCRRFSP